MLFRASKTTDTVTVGTGTYYTQWCIDAVVKLGGWIL